MNTDDVWRLVERARADVHPDDEAEMRRRLPRLANLFAGALRDFGEDERASELDIYLN
jgi:hypothetical protein